MVHLEALRAMGFLHGVDDATLERLASLVTPQRFETGQELIQQGAEDRDCYLIVHGEVEVTMEGRPLGRVGSGCPEGELGLLLGTRRAATVTALEPTETLVLAADDFDALCESEPEHARAIAEAMLSYFENRFGYRPTELWEPISRRVR